MGGDGGGGGGGGGSVMIPGSEQVVEEAEGLGAGGGLRRWRCTPSALFLEVTCRSWLPTLRMGKGARLAVSHARAFQGRSDDCKIHDIDAERTEFRSPSYGACVEPFPH
jgi:hypothetical protein